MKLEPDHPDLPLGLRHHPRWAARVEITRDGYPDLSTIYAHDRLTIDQAVAAYGQHYGIEEWTGERWEERS